MTAMEFGYTIKEALPYLESSAIKFTRNKEDAADLLQETFLKAYTQRAKFSEGSNVRAWLYTIMRNIFINNYQRMVRRKTFLDTTGILYYLNKGKSESFESEMFKEFARDDLKVALKNLRVENRQPFLLHFSGFQYNEIAEKLKLPLGTVKTRIRNARIELKEYLKDYNKSFFSA